MEEASLSRSPSDSATFCLSLPAQTGQGLPDQIRQRLYSGQQSSDNRHRDTHQCRLFFAEGADQRETEHDDRLQGGMLAVPAKSTRCSRDVRMEVTPSSIVCDSKMQVKTQCEREESAFVLVPPVCRLAIPCLSSRTTSSPVPATQLMMLSISSERHTECAILMSILSEMPMIVGKEIDLSRDIMGICV